MLIKILWEDKNYKKIEDLLIKYENLLAAFYRELSYLFMIKGKNKKALKYMKKGIDFQKSDSPFLCFKALLETKLESEFLKPQLITSGIIK